MSVPELVSRLSDNPILEREKRDRARSWTTPLTMSLYVCVLGGVAIALFSSAVSGAPDRHPDAADMAEVVFLTAALQLALLVLAVPALAAPAISGERERGTLDILLLGRLTPRHIVRGKVTAALAFPWLLLVAAVPVLVAAFLYAGLSLGQLLLVELVTLVTAVSVGALAMVSGAVLPRSVPATVAAYAATLTLYVGAALVGLALQLDDAAASSVHPFVFANPFYALRSVILEPSPAGAPVVQPWQVSVLAQMVLSVLCLATAARVLGRSPAR